MRRKLYSSIVAAFLASVSAGAAALPIGAWEGAIKGKKAVALQVADAPPHGSIVFYILRDNGDGSHDNSASAPAPIEGAAWDGEVLHFAVAAGGRMVRFELRNGHAGRAVLKRLSSGGEGELTIELTRAR